MEANKSEPENQPKPADHIANSSPIGNVHSDPLSSSMPPATPPRTNKNLMIVYILLVVVVIVFGTYIATRSVTTKTKTVTVSTPVAIAPAEVQITSKGYVPAAITIKVNQAVVWTNTDSAKHEVNSDPYPTDNNYPDFNDNAPINQNSTWAFVFNKAGTYTYHDNLNPYTFKGTVIVRN